MPPGKRRGPQAKMASKPEPSKQPSSSKSIPTPAPAPLQPPLPPPPQPVESEATKVRKEWSKFVDAWYEPQKKKLVDKLQKDLLVKYKSLGSAKETQKLREMELFEKLDSLAQRLAQPARTEWERRLELAQLREEQWNDMTGEEQQAVMSVFVGFVDDIEDMDDDVSAEPSSVEEEESVVEEFQYRGVPSYPSAPSRQPVPPTPTRTNFEFVNPTSFFAETMTPPNSTKNLPALSMDHLATLGPSNVGRSAEPVSASAGGVLSFQNWASEVGIVTQQPQSQSQSPGPSSVLMPAQTLGARPRATDNMSRQASAASNLSSPQPKISSPQYSPPNPTTKFSPPINADNLPLGKRYIGPVIAEEEPDPMDEEILKSKMADEYQQYKISLRIQMIYQFHAEAAEFEIKLFETLLADEGTKESRARAVQEHETSMMRLREQKEEERKRLCAEEREKRRQEIRQHLAQRRSVQNRESETGPKTNPPKPFPDKPPVQSRTGKATHQKENVPLAQPAVPTTKLEPASGIKKSISTLSQDEASANEALFANAMAQMAQSKAGSAALTPAQASQNESLFANAAAMLATQGGQQGARGTLQPPSIMKKSLSARSQDHDVPQITVSFADPPAVVLESVLPPAPAPPPPPPPVPPVSAKGKKGKKGQSAAVVPPPVKPVAFAITEEFEPEMEIDAKPSTSTPSLWDPATFVGKNTWGAASTSISAPKVKFSASVEEEPDPDLTSGFTPASVAPSAPAPAPPRGGAGAKKSATAAKKSKKVTIIEEPDVDADPIVTPSALKAKTVKGGWGSTNGKSKASLFAEESEAEPAVPPTSAPVPSAWGKKGAQTPAAGKSKVMSLFGEESEQEPVAPLPPTPAPVTTGWGKKTTQAAGKSKVTPSFTEESEVEPVVPAGWGRKTAQAAGRSKVTSPFGGESSAELAPMAPAWGKKTVQATSKPTAKSQLKATVSDEQESETEESFVPARKNKAKSAWDVPSAPPSASTSMGTQGKKATQQVEVRRSATGSGSKSARVDAVVDPEDEALVDGVVPGALELEEEEAEEDGDANAWFNPENINYWANFMGDTAEAEAEAEAETPQAIFQPTEQSGKHVRWTPTVGEESEDEESGGADEDLAANMWMQFAISGADMPSLGDTLQAPPVAPAESVQSDASIWEQGKGKKKQAPTTGDFGNRAQQTSVFDRAAFAGQWPKMESWLSPPSRGQNSGSTRVF